MNTTDNKTIYEVAHAMDNWMMEENKAYAEINKRLHERIAQLEQQAWVRMQTQTSLVNAMTVMNMQLEEHAPMRALRYRIIRDENTVAVQEIWEPTVFHPNVLFGDETDSDEEIMEMMTNVVDL